MKKSTNKFAHGDGCLRVYNDPKASHCTMEDLKNKTACPECRWRQPRLCNNCTEELRNGFILCKHCGHKNYNGNDYSIPAIYDKVRAA